MSDIDDIIKILDSKCNEDVSRIKINCTDELEEGVFDNKYHHGRCDVGSPWAKGTVSNFNTIDNCQ